MLHCKCYILFGFTFATFFFVFVSYFLLRESKMKFGKISRTIHHLENVPENLQESLTQNGILFAQIFPSIFALYLTHCGYRI